MFCKGLCAAFEFFLQVFGQISNPWLEYNSSLIKCPFLRIPTNTAVWGKFVVKIPREGTKKDFKYHTHARTPPLCLNIDT